jgi:hypothetical protein
MTTQPPSPVAPLPNLFVVGAAKCATTTIHQMLKRAPGVAMSRRKEPSHFCVDLHRGPDFPRTQGLIRRLTDNHWITDRAEYLATYPDTAARWMGEASTAYLFSTEAAEQIRAFNPDARIVISLRSPIRRAYSEYQMRAARDGALGSFSEVIRKDRKRALAGDIAIFETYVTAGLYASQVERYLQAFPRENVLILIVDRPGVRFGSVSGELSRFLGTPVENLGQGPAAVTNAAKSPRHPALNQFLFRWQISSVLSRLIPKAVKRRLAPLYYRPEPHAHISVEDHAYLAEVFREDVQRLSALIGENLDFWLEPSAPPRESLKA